MQIKSKFAGVLRTKAVAIMFAAAASALAAVSAFGIKAGAETYTAGDFEYTVSSSKATITGYIGSGGNISIPSKVNGYTVTAIGRSAFGGNTSITGVSIPSSVISIGYNAFNNCQLLETVTMSNGTSTATMGDCAFKNCTRLKSISIPSNYKNTGYQAFYDCDSLTSVTIRDGSVAKTIDGYSFYGCGSLEKVSIPSSVTSIGSFAFNLCENLTSVNIPEGVTSISNNAFGGCLRLASAKIPSTCTAIGNEAFYNCQLLSTVSLAAGTKEATIGSYAFRYCSKLAGIAIPANYSKIGYGAFHNLDSLKTVTLGGGKVAASIDGYAFYDCDVLEEIIIPGRVTSIGSYAFNCCEKLTKVTLCEGLKTIENNVFGGCEALQAISIPSTVTVIGNEAFYSCNGMSRLTIRNGKLSASIGTRAFKYCSSLPSVTIPGNYNSIGYEAFSKCTSISSLVIANGDLSKKMDDRAFQDCTALKSVSLPSALTSIGSFAFASCTQLASINIPEGVASISNNAFGGCISLTSAVIPSTCRTIGKEAFYNCSVLKNVTFNPGESLNATLDSFVFQKCPKLGYVVLPENYTSIGYKCFDGDENAVVIYPESCSIGDYAFTGVLGTMGYTVSGGKVSINSISTSLTSVTLPSKISGHPVAYVKASYGGSIVHSHYYENGKCSICGAKVAAPASPVISTLTAGYNQVTAKWNAVSGAEQYAILYRPTSTSSYTTIVTNGTSYTIKGLVGGQRYAFAARAYANGVWSDVPAAKYATPLSASNPVITELLSANQRVAVCWNKVSGASKYAVLYRPTTSNKYITYGMTTGSRLTVQKLTNDVRYAFVVRAYVNGKWTSFTSNHIKYAAPTPNPVITSVKEGNGKVSLTWGKVGGATKYAVLYRAGKTGNYTVAVANLKGTSYTLKGLRNDVQYCLVVKAYVNGKWTSYCSLHIKYATPSALKGDLEEELLLTDGFGDEDFISVPEEDIPWLTPDGVVPDDNTPVTPDDSESGSGELIPDYGSDGSENGDFSNDGELPVLYA